MGAATPFAHLPHDGPGHMVPREQLWWPPCGLVALSVSPSFVRVGRRLRPVVLRDIIEHEATAVAVLQNAALASDALRDQNAAYTRRPDHAGRVELDELHVLQRGASPIRQRVAVARVFPAIARDPVGAADPAGGEYHGFGAEDVKATTLPVIDKRACDSVSIL